MPDTVSQLSDRTKGRKLENPPQFFDDERKKVWTDVLDRCPLDLRIEHRDIVTQYCLIIFKANSSLQPLPTGEARLLRQYAMDLGMMPEGGQSPVMGRPRKDAGKAAEHAKPESTGFDRFKTPARPQNSK